MTGKTCFLCGHPLPSRRWWQLPRSACPDEASCRARFTNAHIRGRITPPARPDGRWTR